ncbi:MAG: ERF family protein [Methanobrevibacter sp.]|nr:ERF family protein [Methanobrevibacter sp.]
MENLSNSWIDFCSIINEISQDKRLVPDLMKAENGNNFRAISESAILDVIDPILRVAGVFYKVMVKDYHLDIREAYGSKGKKLQFIATLAVQLVFMTGTGEIICATEAVGMGIDDNDKAMGKAYTYAVKYALLKLFRLRYGDDADFEASKPLYLEKPKEEKKEEIKPAKEDKKSKSAEKVQKREKSSGKEVPMSEAQRDYILGMMKKFNVPEKEVISKFGYEPSRDEFIPMKSLDL